MWTTGITVTLLLGLVGCGTATAPGQAWPTGGGEEPTTPAALAWVATQYVGDPQSASAEGDIAEELGNSAIGAELLYPSDDQQGDGDALVVAVGTGRPDGLACTADHQTWGGCVKNGQGTLLWEDEEPEEDPGNVGVAVIKGETMVVVFQSGPAITGDPRNLELPTSVADMFAIAVDPRVDMTTSEEAVATGAGLPYWHN